MPLGSMKLPSNSIHLQNGNFPMAKQIPAHHTGQLLGSMKPFMADPRNFLLTLQDYDAPVVKFRLAHMRAYYLATPEATLHVVQKNQANYYKGGTAMNIGRKLLGNGLVFSNGDFWKRQRRIANPAFHNDCLRHYVAVMQNRTEVMLDELAEASQGGKAINIYDAFNQLAITIVRDNLFGSSLDEDVMREILTSINYVMVEGQKRVRAGFLLPLWIPTPGNRKLTEAMQMSERVMTELIQSKAAEKEPGHSLIDMLIHTPDPETSEFMSAQQIADEAKIFFLAGTDTSANAMTWLAYLLHLHPEVRERVREEVTAVLGDRKPGMEDVKQLEYTNRVIKETLRMYAPAWLLTRSNYEADEIEGYDLPKGSNIFFSPLMMHHHPDHWEEPGRFDPDRWLPERKERNNHKAYMPFIVGPRKCIGFRFAELEIAIMLAMLVQRFTWELPAGHHPEIEYSGAIRPLGGLPVLMHPLNQTAMA